MNFSLPQTYLIGLSILLLAIAIVVGRQILKVRQDEIKLNQLEKSDINLNQDVSQLYELASAQLRKRLYPQATSTLKAATKLLDNEPNEAKALVENALGFALAAQDDFKSAIKHYSNAIKAKEEYPVALNNLAFAKQRLLKTDEAYDIYKKVLMLDPKNKTAKKQMQRLERRIKVNSSNQENQKGF